MNGKSRLNTVGAYLLCRARKDGAMADETPGFDAQSAASNTTDDCTQEALAAQVECLQSPRRRTRQDAAREIGRYAQEHPEWLVPFSKEFEQALTCKESQTRWEMLRALATIAYVDDSVLTDVVHTAESSLFDDESVAVRLAACRYLTVYGAQSEKNSNQVVALVGEFMQCYHGDPEYRDILSYVLHFAQGSISQDAAQVISEHVSFDACHSHGYIRKFSADIIEKLKQAH